MILIPFLGWIMKTIMLSEITQNWWVLLTSVEIVFQNGSLLQAMKLNTEPNISIL